jgi:hypothetical protein
MAIIPRRYTLGTSLSIRIEAVLLRHVACFLRAGLLAYKAASGGWASRLAKVESYLDRILSTMYGEPPIIDRMCSSLIECATVRYALADGRRG